MVLINRTDEKKLPEGSSFCQKIVSEIVNRNIKALEDLYDQYSGMIYGNVFQELADPHRAETVCKAVFVRAWYEIDHYQHSKCRLFTWLMQLAREEMRNKPV